MSDIEKRSEPTAAQREVIARRAEWRSCRNTRSMWRLVNMGLQRVRDGGETYLALASRVEVVDIVRAWSKPSADTRRRWLPRTMRT